MTTIAKFARSLERKCLTGPDKGDLLSMLLHACADGNNGLDAALTDDELLGHTSVFLAAGLETSANALTDLVFAIAAPSRDGGCVVDELTAVLHGAPPTVDQIDTITAARSRH